MGIRTNWFQRQMANGLVLLLIAPLAQAAPVARQQEASGTVDQTSRQSTPAQQQSTPAQQQPAQRPNAPEPQQTNTNTTEPVGTAAAPYESPVGAAVSRPAGAAIAPAKQKRRRSFLIRMGLVVGAAVAVGTVVALSKASPSRPSH